MYRVFILTERQDQHRAFPWALAAEGLTYQVGTELDLDRSSNGDQETRPDAVLMDLDVLSDKAVHRLGSHCRKLGLPIVAVVAKEHLLNYDPSQNLDDFILRPFGPRELLVRLHQAIFRIKGPQDRNGIWAGDLLIDQERYEVSLAGKKLLLTYKEYQLLVLLASHPGRVYTRDTLLSQVWGYDYLGGTRTVDVHIRRLRSKIEDASHSFIETIRNVGYRFKSNP